MMRRFSRGGSRRRAGLAIAGRRKLQFERLEARQLMAVDVLITEFMASNSGGLQDGDGDSSDWLELYNAGDATVDLGGYYLTDDAEELSKWSFLAGTTIAPGAALIVFASDKGAAGPVGELHTDFALSAGGEYLALVEPDGATVVHDYAPNFPAQQQNVSYGLSMTSETTTLVDDGSAMRYWAPTNGSSDAAWRSIAFNDAPWSVASAGVGFEGNPGSTNDYTSLIDATVPAGTTSVYTRFEFALAVPTAFNSLKLEMIYDDGFVAYLNGQLIASANAPASLAWDSAAGPVNRGDEVVLADYVAFDVTAFLGALQPGDNVLAIHALNQSGSSDMLMIPRLVAGAAEVVEPLVTGVLDVATPGAPNGEVFLGVVDDTSFSVDRGFYSAPFDVTIATTTSGATIVYTTDGSAPMVDDNLNITNGTLYAGPVHIAKTTNLRAGAFKLGHVPTNVDTQTYIFTSDVIQQRHQSTINAGFPAIWGSRAADYGLDPDVIGPNDLFGGVYAALIEDSLKAIPTISITIDNDDFFGPTGIYANVTGEGIAWERAASVELIDSGGAAGFQIDTGLRVHGAASRSLSKKNALRLLFKTEYGDSKLEYPLFGDTGAQEFDTIVLRPHFNDGWGWDGAEGDPLFARDQWFRDTQAAMGHASARGNVVHLYVNGLYWGLYNPSERPDNSYAAETFGGDKEEYDVVNHDGLQDGSLEAYNTMLAMVQAINAAGSVAAKNAAYQLLQGKLPNGQDDPAAEAYLDVVNYIDYMILNHYGGNNDWPDRNWFANRRRGAESEGYRFFAWDSEISLALSSRTSINENNLSRNTGAAQAYATLRNYEEFRLQFADRIHRHLFNGGALYVNTASPAYDPDQPQNNVPAARFAALTDRVYESIVAESARWGDQHVAFPRTRDVDWQNELNYMLGAYFRDRHNIVLGQWVAAGLYPATAAPEFLIDGARQHGGATAAGTQLDYLNANSGAPGVIYYTTDGSDPRLVGGAFNSASAAAFSGAIPILQSMHVKARILRNGVWSALTEATFTPATANADFNGDGAFDGADFLAWQRGVGTAGNAAPADGDANGDSNVDALDLAIWKEQFAVGPAVVAASLASVNATWHADSLIDLARGVLALNNSTKGKVSPPLRKHSWQPFVVAPAQSSGLTVRIQREITSRCFMITRRTTEPCSSALVESRRIESACGQGIHKWL